MQRGIFILRSIGSLAMAPFLTWPAFTRAARGLELSAMPGGCRDHRRRHTFQSGYTRTDVIAGRGGR
jgi:hypothetical protein